jgi:hypothetical protein
MLRFIIGFITFIVFAAYLAALVITIILGEGIWIIALGALVGFYVAWTIAGGVIFSPFSYFVLSDWDLFTKKLKHSVGGSVIGGIIGLLIASLAGY